MKNKQKQPTLREIVESMDDERNYRLEDNGYYLMNGAFLKGRQWKQLINMK